VITESQQSKSNGKNKPQPMNQLKDDYKKSFPEVQLNECTCCGKCKKQDKKDKSTQYTPKIKAKGE
jgi:hypothetical protein